jgi:hypothetical protein
MKASWDGIWFRGGSINYGSSKISRFIVLKISRFIVMLVFPNISKYLNLSHNLLNEQDIQTLFRLWRSTWQENSSAIITKAIVIFSTKT